MAFSLVWMPQALRSAGLKVAEVPGWADRGRGPMQAIRGVICHHTGTPGDQNMPTLKMLINGRSDLPGPLSQLGLARDGTYYVIAAGRANHAGAGSWAGHSGNSQFIGIEAENSGTANDMWPEVQMDAYRRGVAALLKHLELSSDRCCGHREYAPRRKPDPLFDMDAFRTDVRSIINGTAIVRPLIPAADLNGKPTLRRGARGDAVKQVQSKLGLKDDGIFGPTTEAAVRSFQRGQRLVADGIVGPKSWEKLGL